MNTNRKILLSSLLIGLIGFSAFVFSVGVWVPPIDRQPSYITFNSWAVGGDGHGQSFEAIEIYENSTGSWVIVDTLYYDTAVTSFEIEGGSSIKLITYTWLNSTLVNAGSGAEGYLYQILNATVKFSNDTLVYSSGNFTAPGYDTGIDPPLWLYDYEHVFNYAFEYSYTYFVNVSYFTYW